MRRRLAAAFFFLSLGGMGCAAVLGLDSGSPEDADAGKQDATLPDAGATPSGCPAGQKSCGGACVGVDDPNFGCGPTTCGACSGKNVTGFACQAGACVITGCAAGLGDCDDAAATGCETDTTNGSHCGNCTQVCPDASPLCAGNTCINASQCDGSVCGTSCIDTTGSVHHCGSCSNDCTNPQPARTNAACVGSQCKYVCTTGAQDCNHDLGSPAGDGCECTTGCSGSVCCPPTGCVGDGGTDAPPPDSGVDSGGGGDAGVSDACATGGSCVGPDAGCTVGLGECCCPMTCHPGLGAPTPFSAPTPLPPAPGLGGVCCISPAVQFPLSWCNPPTTDPCCSGTTCKQLTQNTAICQ